MRKALQNDASGNVAIGLVYVVVQPHFWGALKTGRLSSADPSHEVTYHATVALTKYAQHSS
jgi:hypothetical protein